MGALHEVLGRGCHIVAKVVETKLVVRTECDVGIICGTTLGRVGLGLVDTCHRQAVEHIERSHPLRVTLGEVVVYGHYMHSIAGKGVQEHRKGCHKGLTFTGGHLGYLTLVKHYTTYQLALVVYHIPHGLVAACHPAIAVEGFVAFDAHKVAALGCQIAVELGCCHFHHFVLRKSAGCILHYGIRLGKGFLKAFFQDVEYLLLHLVDACP